MSKSHSRTVSRSHSHDSDHENSSDSQEDYIEVAKHSHKKTRSKHPSSDSKIILKLQDPGPAAKYLIVFMNSFSKIASQCTTIPDLIAALTKSVKGLSIGERQLLALEDLSNLLSGTKNDTAPEPQLPEYSLSQYLAGVPAEKAPPIAKLPGSLLIETERLVDVNIPLTPSYTAVYNNSELSPTVTFTDFVCNTTLKSQASGAEGDSTYYDFTPTESTWYEARYRLDRVLNIQSFYKQSVEEKMNNVQHETAESLARSLLSIEHAISKATGGVSPLFKVNLPESANNLEIDVKRIKFLAWLTVQIEQNNLLHLEKQVYPISIGVSYFIQLLSFGLEYQNADYHVIGQNSIIKFFESLIIWFSIMDMYTNRPEFLSLASQYEIFHKDNQDMQKDIQSICSNISNGGYISQYFFDMQRVASNVMITRGWGILSRFTQKDRIHSLKQFYIDEQRRLYGSILHIRRFEIKNGKLSLRVIEQRYVDNSTRYGDYVNSLRYTLVPTMPLVRIPEYEDYEDSENMDGVLINRLEFTFDGRPRFLPGSFDLFYSI